MHTFHTFFSFVNLQQQLYSALECPCIVTLNWSCNGVNSGNYEPIEVEEE